MQPHLKIRRSPNHPGVSLRKAVRRARDLYRNIGRNSVSTATALQHWGYSPDSGPGRVLFAAMKQYGLVEATQLEGDRGVRLTDLAATIVEFPEGAEDTPYYVAALQNAALNPELNARVWREYGTILGPSVTLRTALQRDLGFTERGARTFLRDFLDTVAFAKLDQSNTLPNGNSARARERPAGGEESARLRFQVSNRIAELTVSGGPLTEVELSALIAYLEVQKRISRGPTVIEQAAPPAAIEAAKPEAKPLLSPFPD